MGPGLHLSCTLPGTGSVACLKCPDEPPLTEHRLRVLITAAGGEGATAREVLRHKSVTKLVMVDIDKVGFFEGECCAADLPLHRQLLCSKHLAGRHFSVQARATRRHCAAGHPSFEVLLCGECCTDRHRQSFRCCRLYLSWEMLQALLILGNAARKPGVGSFSHPVTLFIL